MHALLLALVVASPASSVDDEAEIARIRTDFKEIQADLPSFKKQKRILLGISAEGASVTACRDGERIRKISVEALGETGKYLADFYYREEVPFFAFVQQIDYGGNIVETLKGKKLRNDVTEEDRLYFSNLRLLRWLRFKKKVSPSDPAFEAKRKSVLGDAQSMLLLMKTKAPSKNHGACEWVCRKEAAGQCLEYACN